MLDIEGVEGVDMMDTTPRTEQCHFIRDTGRVRGGLGCYRTGLGT